MSTRELSLQEVLTAAVDYQLSNIYTSMPGVVVGVHSDLTGLRADVQPVLNLRNMEGTENTPRPSILNVPVQMPISTVGGLTHPIRKGDPVMLLFSMRGLDVWKIGDGTPSMPSDRRKFNVRDCIAIPGVYPLGMSPNSPSNRNLDHDPNDVVLTHNIGTGSEVEIRLKPNGEVIVNSPAKVTVNCQNAEVNASDEIKLEATDVNILCENYSVGTTNYSVIATGDNVSQGSFRFQGSIELNGTTIEDHTHGGVQPGGDRTNEFGS